VGGVGSAAAALTGRLCMVKQTGNDEMAVIGLFFFIIIMLFKRVLTVRLFTLLS